MTAGCIFRVLLSPVCFAGGSFFVDQPRGAAENDRNKRRNSNEKKIVFRIVGAVYGADASAGVGNGGGRNCNVSA